ncbi:MAG: NAD(P)/FAD-dependent oxidoreductase [Micrococcus sp.]|nr:NAD(P)/FAD-dependent oxidoreductase [Micrococcus sp.]
MTQSTPTRPSTPHARSRSVLVVGAGMAGMAIAVLLTRGGHRVTLVDAADSPAQGGYQITLGKKAVAIMQRLGARQVWEDVSSPCAPVTFRVTGRTVARVPAGVVRLAQRSEVLSGMADVIQREVEIDYGRELTALTQQRETTTAHFADGASEDYDLVIGADGLHSTVRQLMVDATDQPLHRNDRVHVWVDTPGRYQDGEAAELLFGWGAHANVLPYAYQDATLTVTAVDTRGQRRDKAELLATSANLLHRSGPALRGLAEQVGAAELDTVHVTPFSQVRASTWHARNVVLLGDAAHCMDPLSGSGGQAALVGAQILAEEIARHPRDLARAAGRYTQRARRSVRAGQLLTSAYARTSTLGGAAGLSRRG